MDAFLKWKFQLKKSSCIKIKLFTIGFHSYGEKRATTKSVNETSIYAANTYNQILTSKGLMNENSFVGIVEGSLNNIPIPDYKKKISFFFFFEKTVIGKWWKIYKNKPKFMNGLVKSITDSLA